MKQSDLYDKITNQLIEILQTHKNLNYSCNWTPAEVTAKNVITGRKYQGFNQLYLSFVASRYYDYNRWITYLQGIKAGASIRKGEHSRMVTFWKWKYYDSRNGKDMTQKVEEEISKGNPIPEYIIQKPFLRYYNVFNVQQFEDMPDKYLEPEYRPTFTESEKDQTAEELINNTGAVIEYHTGNSCYYMPKADKIVLCRPEQFKGSEAYYSVLFHELGHWSGHETRLNRDILNPFGSKEYAAEELVAEFFSAFMCADNGFTSKITNNAAYIDSWLKVLKDDKKLALIASAKAQKAADYVYNLVHQRTTQNAENKA